MISTEHDKTTRDIFLSVSSKVSTSSGVRMSFPVILSFLSAPVSFISASSLALLVRSFHGSTGRFFCGRLQTGAPAQPRVNSAREL